MCDKIVLWDDKDYLVIVPLTEEVSNTLSEGTKWTSLYQKRYRIPRALTDNCFYDFYQSSPLIIAIHKPSGNKYRFNKRYTPTDANDNKLNNVTDPMLKLLCMLVSRVDSLSSYQDIQFNSFNLAKLILNERHDLIEYVDINHPQYIELCLIAIKEHSYLIYPLYDKLNDDKIFELFNKAIDSDDSFLTMTGFVFSFWSRHLTEYKTLFKQAIRLNHNHIHSLLNFESVLGEETYDLARFAIQANPEAIQHIPRKFKIYLELCAIAVQYKPNTIAYMGRLKPETYQQLALSAIHHDWRSIVYVKTSLPDYKEICAQIVEKEFGIVNQTYVKNRKLIGKAEREVNPIDYQSIEDKVLSEHIDRKNREENGLTPLWLLNNEPSLYKQILQECYPCPLKKRQGIPISSSPRTENI